MKQYFLHNGVEQLGPFNLEELKAQENLSKETYIWYEGLEEWTALEEIEELKSAIPAMPPPFAPKTAATIPLPIPKQYFYPEIDIDEGPIKRRSIGKTLLLLAGFIVLALIGVFAFYQIQQQQYESEKAKIRNNISSYVVPERNEYHYSNLGGIFNLEISVRNRTKYLIDKVEVRIDYIKPNGDVWDSRITEFNLLSGFSTLTNKIPDSRRGTSIRYEIVSVKSAALGLY